MQLCASTFHESFKFDFNVTRKNEKIVLMLSSPHFCFVGTICFCGRHNSFHVISLSDSFE